MTFPEQINWDRNCSYNDRQFAICFLFAKKFATSASEPLPELESAYPGSVRSRTDGEDSVLRTTWPSAQLAGEGDELSRQFF
ncbi:hypothetical protein C4D60_Mb09t13360 [Musa balbisiana]|uniref:Uncharacterized protein n=1 Tax=Musa balbisiana TaxID=52838 RepID=A0A4S8IHG8_MUSBA|nr:hypothetical protein C4D60_Mb09t13360 [Musa balbisiana]